MTNEVGQENRVLIVMPTGRDADLIRDFLGRGDIGSESIRTHDLARAIEEGAGAVLLAEEALGEVLFDLERTVERQPVWSDIPIILFSGQSSRPDELLQTLNQKFNATIVERPIRISILVSAVRGALRARQRQYQARDLLVQLEQADKQKDLFLATLSHELRTPLNSILGWIHILSQKNINDKEVEHALDVIARNARAQAEMIADILLVSRVITGKVELALEVFNITNLVEESIEIIQPSAAAKGIAISLHRSPGQPAVVKGDKERLHQVFLNLLTNAVKFTPQGGNVNINISSQDGMLKIVFDDDGIGIDPRFLPYIFERFRQADNKHTRRVGGLGLGLAIVYHLIELHGGTVTAESSGENCGACFTISLPLAELEDQGDSGAFRQTGSNGSNGRKEILLDDLKVLIVEDDEDSRDMLATILTFSGAKVETASDVATAFDVFGSFLPDILISDVGLPGQDGYDLIRQIRNLPLDEAKIPAIALTGYVSTQDQIQAVNAGYQEHLPKPVDTDKLIDTILKLSRTKTELGAGPAGSKTPR